MFSNMPPSQTPVQTSLFDSSPQEAIVTRPAGDLHRLFFALMPPPEVADDATRQSQQWAIGHKAEGRPVRADRLHVTLLHLGDFAGRLPSEVVDAACLAARNLKRAAFEVSFDRTMSFRKKSGGHPFVMIASDGAPAVQAFQADLVDAVVRAGIQFPRTGFTPHMTLRYDPVIWPAEPATPVRWAATEFVLIESLVGKTLHRPLARWALG